MPPLTAAQLDFFCTDVLNIHNASELKQRDPVALLDLLAERMHKYCPFNNIWDCLSASFLGNKRYKVAPYTIYRAPCQMRLFMGQGGTCLHLASLLLCLLRHLGFQGSYMGMGLTRNKPGMEMLHFIVLVSGVTSTDDIWLIDPGTRLAPLFKAVPLHDVRRLGTLDVGRSSYVENKFTYSTETNDFTRHFRHLGAGDEYGKFYEFDTEEYSLLDPEDPEVLDFLHLGQKKRVMSYMQLRQKSEQDVGAFWERNFILTGYSQDRAVVFVNNKLKVEDENGILRETILSSKEELLDNLFKSYPRMQCPEVLYFIDKFWTAKYGANL